MCARKVPARRRRRLLYYCQSLVGVGHLASSRLVLRELARSFDVELAWGGPGEDSFMAIPGVRSVRLPTLLHDERAGLRDPAGHRGLEEQWRARAAALDGFLRPPYDALVLEFFPFGRRRFKAEIARLLERSAAPAVFCSVGDIILPRSREEEAAIAEFAARRLRLVLVRSDPRVVRFEESFGAASALGARLRYTGYVADAPPPARTREEILLVSQGGSDAGWPLLEAMASAARLLPRFRVELAGGARTPASALRGLPRAPNLRVSGFLPDFRARLSRARVSISLCGENTMMDVIATRTPALVLPCGGSSEQRLRALRLEKLGFVQVLQPRDLRPRRLRERIRRVLAAPYPAFSIDMDGARRSRELIESSLGS